MAESVLLYRFLTTEEKCGGFFTHSEVEQYMIENNVPENPECVDGIRLSSAGVIPPSTYAEELLQKIEHSESLRQAYEYNPREYVASMAKTEYPDGGRVVPEEWIDAVIWHIENVGKEF